MPKHIHVSASNQSLHFILSLRLYSNFITARPGIVKQFLKAEKVTVLPHPLYSQDLAPASFYFFTPKKVLYLQLSPLLSHQPVRQMYTQAAYRDAWLKWFHRLSYAFPTKKNIVTKIPPPIHPKALQLVCIIFQICLFCYVYRMSGSWVSLWNFETIRGSMMKPKWQKLASLA